MTDKKLFIFGAGFSASAIAEKSKYDFAEITGTTRSEEKCGSLESSQVQAVVFNGMQSTPELLKHLATTTHLLVSIAPGDADPVLTAFPDICEQMPNLQWIGYLSTVGVYGNHDGAWVDEETEPKPVSKRSIQRIEAESQWQKKVEQAGIPIAIFRLSGIYGPGRNAFVTIKNGKSRRLVKKGQVFNRIHREDIGTAVQLAMRNNIGGIFNITDDEPAPPQDVVTYAHDLMGIEPPPEMDFITADITPMARSFYGENKRVSNKKSKEVLGMTYAWPNYRYSLEKMWRENLWQ